MPIRLLLVSILLLVCLLVIEGQGNDNGQLPGQKPRDGVNTPAAHCGVAKDMPASKVVALLRQPRKVSRQILFRSHLEQWSYDEPIGLRIELHGVRGQEAHVVSVHSLRLKNP